MRPADRLRERIAECERVAELLASALPNPNAPALWLTLTRRDTLRDALALLAEDAPEPAEPEPAGVLARPVTTQRAAPPVDDPPSPVDAPADPAPAAPPAVDASPAPSAEYEPPPAAAPSPPPVATVPPPDPAPAPAPDAAPPAAAPDTRDPADRYTPDRRALIARIWGDLGLTAQQVLDQVNALPGLPIASTEALHVGIRTRLGLPGSRMAYADQLAAQAAAAGAPPPDPLAALDAEERAEASRIVLDQGQGARALADWFGWPLPRAQEVAAALRATRKDAAA